MNNNQILGALALDLRRVAQGYYRGSEAMASRFAKEAKARKIELQNVEIKDYIFKLLSKMDKMLEQKDHKKLAEDALMYSVLFQNAAMNSPLDSRE